MLNVYTDDMYPGEARTVRIRAGISGTLLEINEELASGHFSLLKDSPEWYGYLAVLLTTEKERSDIESKAALLSRRTES